MGSSGHVEAGMNAFEGRQYRALRLHLTIGIQYAVFQVGLFLVLAVLIAALPADAAVVPAAVIGLLALIVCGRHMRRLIRLGKSLQKQQDDIDMMEAIEDA